MAKDDAYRFEPGGGHWIFGGDPEVLGLIDALAPVERSERRSAVYFREQNLYVPYPLQDHLDHLPAERRSARSRRVRRRSRRGRGTLTEWLAQRFGATLCQLFFHPFHQLYTAGLCDRIAPQEARKSPAPLAARERRACGCDDGRGVTTRASSFRRKGSTASCVASPSDVASSTESAPCGSIRARARCSSPTGRAVDYDRLVSTLPLDQTLAMAGLRVDAPPDPHTSVLVLNIGALRGPACPDQHWIYVPDSRSGFHRIGFYSNVDVGFLPARYAASARASRSTSSARSLAERAR